LAESALPSSSPTITPSSDYLAGEVKHLVKAGERCEGIHERVINDIRHNESFG
jgi:hypothetical protein